MMQGEQKVQERQYSFPYHHLPRYESGRYWQLHDLQWGYEYLSYVRYVLSQLEARSFESLLDVGSGDGRLLGELRERFPHKKLLGLDYSERAVSLAQAMSQDVSFVRADISRETVPGGPFDVVTLVETLEHVPLGEVRGFLEGIRRNLVPGGALLLTVPSRNVPMSSKHFQHFDAESLENTVSGQFYIERLQYLNRNSALVEFTQRLISNSWFVFRKKRIMGELFRMYETRYLMADPGNARRIFAWLRARG